VNLDRVPWLLWSRAWVLGLLAAGLGTAGHVSADGLLPGAGMLATLVVVMVALSSLLLRRPASGARLALALAAGQAVVHVVLSVAGGHRGGTTTLHHAAHVQTAAHEVQGSVLPVDQVLTHVTTQAPMMLAHTAAAALLGWWLARGESALWTLVALASRRLVVAIPVLAVVDPLPHQLTTPAPCPAGPRSPWQAHPRTRRGPPLAVMC
jgi:hypothetical protein